MRNAGDSFAVRYDWVDTLRFLGIFAVYIGHLTHSGGKLFPFVYIYNVPLFFLVSGFFAPASFGLSFSENLKKKFFTLVIPYYVYCLLNMVMFLLIENAGSRRFLEMVEQSLLGIRGQGFAWALWFLPCLFVIATLFDLMYRIFKSSRFCLPIILVISFILHFIIANALPNIERFVANWFFSFDSALYFLVYYAFGAVIFPHIKEIRFSAFSGQGKLELVVVTLIAFGAVGYMYFFETGFRILNLPMQPRPSIDVLYSLLKALTVIYFNFILAHCLSKIKLFAQMGQNTLIYCGTEEIIKRTVSSVFTMARLSVTLRTPYIAFLYTLLLLILSHFTIVPFIHKNFALLAGKFRQKAAIPASLSAP